MRALNIHSTTSTSARRPSGHLTEGSGTTRLINVECTYTDYVCKAPVVIFKNCIPSWMICDGKPDCADFSDERNCRVLRKGKLRFNYPEQIPRGQRQSMRQPPNPTSSTVDSSLARAATKFFGLFSMLST